MFIINIFINYFKLTYWLYAMLFTTITAPIMPILLYLHFEMKKLGSRFWPWEYSVKLELLFKYITEVYVHMYPILFQ